MRRKTQLYLTIFVISLLALLALAPLLGSPMILRILMLANLYAVYAMSWDILSGYTGQISFGHSFFIGLGAYTSGLLTMHTGLPLAAAMLLGAAAALAGGLLIAFPALRLHGPYLSLITLIAPLLAMRLVQIFSKVTGGEYGLKCQFDLATLQSRCVASPQQSFSLNYYDSLILLAGVFFVLFALAHSRWGAIFEAIREDEGAVQAAGINTAKYKTLAFMISAFIAGLGGAFHIHFYFNGYVPRSILGLDLSIEVLIAAVVGGMGTILGPFFGAYFLVLGREYLGFLGGWRMFVFGAIALLILFFRPRGLISELRWQWARLRRRAAPAPPSAPGGT